VPNDLSTTPTLRQRVFERDLGLCWLCQKPCRFDLRPPHPAAFTLDHVKPKGLGGGNAFDNLKAAHYICNQVRGMWFVDDLTRIPARVQSKVRAKRKQEHVGHPPRRVHPRPVPHIGKGPQSEPLIASLADMLGPKAEALLEMATPP